MKKRIGAGKHLVIWEGERGGEAIIKELDVEEMDRWGETGRGLEMIPSSLQMMMNGTGPFCILF